MDYIIGGNHYQLFNAELRFPIPLYNSLAGAVFFDAGNVWSRSSEMQFRDVRTSVGAGIRFRTPIGPLRLDYGRQLRPGLDPEEKKWEIHFGVGHVF